MTTTTDQTIDVPVFVVGDACPAGHRFCDGICADGYHSGPMFFVEAERFRASKQSWVGTDLTVNPFAFDGDPGPEAEMVSLIVDDGLDSDGIGEVRLTAKAARKTAARLSESADLADPLPLDAMVISPTLLHLGDELDTITGWQKVTSLAIHDGPPAQVHVGTSASDGDDTWPFDATELVRIRRRIHGSCAIQFLAPIPTATGATR